MRYTLPMRNHDALYRSLPKTIARYMVTDRIPGRRRPAKSALFLPGAQLLCVRQAINAGLIDPRTTNIFVEQNASLAQLIRDRARRWFQPAILPYVHAQPLHYLSLEDALYGDKLEFAFLDLCKSLTLEVADWIKAELSPNLAPGAAVAITLARTRTTSFMKNMMALITSNRIAKRLHERSRQMINATQRVGNTERPMAYRPSAPACPHLYSGRRTFLYAEHLSERYHEVSAHMLTAMQLLLPRWTFDLDCLIEYKQDAETTHGSRMTAMRLSNFRQTRSPVCPYLQRRTELLMIRG